MPTEPTFRDEVAGLAEAEAVWHEHPELPHARLTCSCGPLMSYSEGLWTCPHCGEQAVVGRPVEQPLVPHG